MAGGAYMWQQRVASPVLSVATGGLASVILHQGPPSDEMHLTINTARPTRGLYATRARGFGQSLELRADFRLRAMPLPRVAGTLRIRRNLYFH